ncbi:hypothetical protein ABW19_dt0201037 [Dactylella cylindrospora]|nr:hypothetical protein ABW19_dt0201037 [Dactylella cylindrospora]
MDRFLRRKPVSRHATPQDLKDSRPDQVASPPSSYPYSENVAKDNTSSQAEAETIRSLERAYSRHSVSFPRTSGPQYEVRPDQQNIRQEHEHTRMSSTVSFGSETATSTASRASGGTAESAVPQAAPFTPESSIADDSSIPLERTESTGSSYYLHNPPSDADPVVPEAYRNNGYRSISNPAPGEPESGYPVHDSQQTNTYYPQREYHLPKHSYPIPDDKVSNNRYSFKSYYSPDAKSPTTNRQPEKVSYPIESHNSGYDPMKNQYPVSERPEKVSYPIQSHSPGYDPLKVQYPVSERPQSSGGDADQYRQQAEYNPGDDDDLSSECSNDSFIEAERLKYYMAKVSDAVDNGNWQDARDYSTKFTDILIQQARGNQIDPNFLLMNSTIHYMLGDLGEAKAQLDRIPKKKSTDPLVLVAVFNMEAAITLRQGNLDEAFNISRRAAKYARKSDLKDDVNEAHYLSYLICTGKADQSEAKFYKQMIPADFKPPNYISILLSSDPVMEGSTVPKAKEEWERTPPASPELPPSYTSGFGLSVFQSAGLTVWKKGQNGGHPEYHGSSGAWQKAIKLVIDADDASESARYLYKTVYINEPNSSYNMGNNELNYPLLYAIRANKAHAVKAMIAEGKVSIQSDHFIKQPLQLAAELGYHLTGAYILKAGANVSMTSSGDKATPICLAAKRNYKEMVRYLLSYGANPLKDTDEKGNTALRIAITNLSLCEDMIKNMLAALKGTEDYSNLAKLINEANGTFPFRRPGDPPMLQQWNESTVLDLLVARKTAMKDQLKITSYETRPYDSSGVEKWK